MENVNLRNIGLRALQDIYGEGVFMNEALDKHVYSQNLDKQARAFLSRLVSGTLENTILIDYVINQFSKTKTNKMKKIILYIIRLSVYQIYFMDSVPDRAACNEGVKLAKKRKFHALSGFVNGVLRNVIRNRENIIMPDENKKPNEFLSIKYSTPLWLVDYLLEQYEYDILKKVLDSSLKQPMISVRTNNITATSKMLKESFDKDNVVYESGYILPYAISIKKVDQLTGLESYKKGFFQVQDESSMLVGEILNPKEGNLIVDVCSAPGGKATHAAQAMNNTGKVIARDISNYKLEKIRENCKRLQLNNVEIQHWDGLILDDHLIGKADGVIADVPCSGLGIIKKKPDIKFNMTQNKIEGLILIQRDILENAAKYVKKGGILIYSTCTINIHENQENIRWFLEQHNEYELENIELKHLTVELTKTKGMITLLPEAKGVDGFFIAKLRRK